MRLWSSCPSFFSLPTLTASVLVLGACGPQQESSDPSIVGGRLVTASDTGPEKVSTVGINGCTGTIIARDLILTAAHCFQGAQQGGFVLFGMQFNGRDRQIVRIANGLVNPAYSDSHNDVAMLRLAGPLPAGYRPVRLLPSTEALRPGETVRQAGYGSDNTANSFGTLRTVDSSFQGVTRLGAIYVANGRTAACSGDSGGPLYVRRGNEWFTAGITSTAFMDATRRCTGGNHYSAVIQNQALILDMARRLTGRADPFDSGSLTPPQRSTPEPLNPVQPPRSNQPDTQRPARFLVLTALSQEGANLTVRVRNVSQRVVTNCTFTLTPVRALLGRFNVGYELEATLAESAPDQEQTLSFPDPFQSLGALGRITDYDIRKTCAE